MSAAVRALARLDRGEADTLISIRLDRISRSVADFAGLLDRAGCKGWGLVLLSPARDLADPAGRFTANVLASAAQYERELISARTKEGMTQRKLDGWAGGRPAGRPCVLDDNIRRQIITAHTAGTAAPPSPTTSTKPKYPPPTVAPCGTPQPSEQHSKAPVKPLKATAPV